MGGLGCQGRGSGSRRMQAVEFRALGVLGFLGVGV